MRFRLLLWILGYLLGRAGRKNSEFRQQLEGRDLVLLLHSQDGKVARHFIVKDRRISSHRGMIKDPALAIGFKDAAYGFATLTAANKQLAFMQGIQEKNIQIHGNPALLLWFQGLSKYLER